MHILFVTDNFPPETNALASRTFEHAREWVKKGHSVTILTTVPNAPDGKIFDGYKNRLRQTEYIDGIKVVRVISYITANSGFLRRIIDYTSFMKSAIFFGLFESKVDVIVGSSPQFFNAMGAWLLAKIKRKPFIFELRDIWPASINAVEAMASDSIAIRMLEKLELKMYKDATRIVAVTNSFKAYLESKGVDSKKVDVVLNGVDLSRYQPAKEKDPILIKELKLDGKFVIGYLGTIGMAHDLKQVIAAAALVKNSKVHFLFVGAGAEKEELERETIKLNLKNVSFVPRQAKKDIPRYWSLCDLALIHLKNVPLFADVIPSKIFEAMGMGRAILHVQPKGEAVQITHNKQCAIWVEPGSPEKLAIECDKLAENCEQVKVCTEYSAKSAREFSRDTQALLMLESFDKVIKH